jgi:LPS-assembly protein
MNYVRSYSYAVGGAPPVLNDTYVLQIGLRTIGMFSTSLP